jgi:beta-glucosidase
MRRFFPAALVISAISTAALFSPPAGGEQPHRTQGEILDSQQPDQPAMKPDINGNDDKVFLERHEEFVKRDKDAPIGLCLLGDSITDFWSGCPDLFDWYFGRYQPANFAISADWTQHLLWRIDHGELDYNKPKVITLLIGSNNHDQSAEQIARGVLACVKLIREKSPDSKLLVFGLFPRNHDAKDPLRARFKQANETISKVADNKHIFYMDLTSVFLQPDGELPISIFPDGVHPNSAGYKMWGDAIQPRIDELMKS